jgi:hypothetical protein
LLVKHWIRLQQVFRFSTFHAYCRVRFTWVIGFLYITFAWDIFSHKHFLRNFSVRMTILGNFFEGWSTNVHESVLSKRRNCHWLGYDLKYYKHKLIFHKGCNKLTWRVCAFYSIFAASSQFITPFMKY